MYFAPYRYLSPTTAGWISRDPLGMVDGPNAYSYGRSAPIVGADPDGGAWIFVGVLAGIAFLGTIVCSYKRCWGSTAAGLVSGAAAPINPFTPDAGTIIRNGRDTGNARRDAEDALMDLIDGIQDETEAYCSILRSQGLACDECS